MKNQLNITRGAEKKPVASSLLEETLREIPGMQGEFFTGYPLVVAPDGKYSIDATLISPLKGIILFDLIEEKDAGEYKIRQDDLANIIDGRLRVHRELFERRHLRVPLTVINHR